LIPKFILVNGLKQQTMYPSLKKNRIMFFDVETTALLPNRAEDFIPDPSQIATYPHILQLSFILFNLVTRTVDYHSDAYIRPPPDVVVSPFITGKTGITREICDAKGVRIDDALRHFHSAYMMCDTIVSHNLAFDTGMIRVEQLRNNRHFDTFSPAVLRMFNPIYDDINGISHFCTMKATVDLCDITVPRKNGKGVYKKWPTLEELYKHLFSQTPINLHNSIVDSLVGLRCYLKVRHDYDMTDCEFERLISKYLT